MPAKKLKPKEIEMMKSNEKLINTIKLNERTAPASLLKSDVNAHVGLRWSSNPEKMTMNENNEYNNTIPGLERPAPLEGNSSSGVKDQNQHKADSKQPNTNSGAGVRLANANNSKIMASKMYDKIMQNI